MNNMLLVTTPQVYYYVFMSADADAAARDDFEFVLNHLLIVRHKGCSYRF